MTMLRARGCWVLTLLAMELSRKKEVERAEVWKSAGWKDANCCSIGTLVEECTNEQDCCSLCIEEYSAAVGCPVANAAPMGLPGMADFKIYGRTWDRKSRNSKLHADATQQDKSCLTNG